MDVNGSDAAQKLAILAHLAFGARVHWSDIPRPGIDTVDVADMRYAKELGYSIKLLAVAELAAEGLELHVSPTLVRQGTPLAEVRGAYNAISVVGDAVGRVFFHGLGAGQMPTASAVVADLIDTVVGRTAITFRTLDLWSNREAPVTMRDYPEVPGRYYLRFNVDDRPGVLAEIAGMLGRHKISIASVIQHGPGRGGGGAYVPLVIMTHAAAEGDAAGGDQGDRPLAVHPRQERADAGAGRLRCLPRACDGGGTSIQIRKPFFPPIRRSLYHNGRLSCPFSCSGRAGGLAHGQDNSCLCASNDDTVADMFKSFLLRCLAMSLSLALVCPSCPGHWGPRPQYSSPRQRNRRRTKCCPDSLDNALLKYIKIPARPDAASSPAPKPADTDSDLDQQLLEQLGAGEDLGQASPDPLVTSAAECGWPKA